MNKRYYKKIEVFGKSFLFFSNTLLFFECDKKLEDIFEKYDGCNKHNILEQYDKDERKNVQVLLNQIDQIYEAEDKMELELKKRQPKNESLYGIQINPINACNLNCKYCFANGGTHGKSSKLTKNQAKLMIDYLFDNCGNNKELAVTVIGGEPFLNIDVFKYILKYTEEKAKKFDKKVRFFTTTNGTIYDKELMDLIVKHKVNITLSLDSNIREVNDYLRPTKTNKSSYDLIKNTTWNFFKENKTCVHVTITPKNLNIYDIAKSYYDDGVYSVQLEMVKSENFSFTDEQVDLLLKEFDKLTLYLLKLINKNRQIDCAPLMSNIGNLHSRIVNTTHCYAPYGLIAFSPDCEIYPCDVLMWDKYKIGSLKDGVNKLLIDDLTSDIKECKECNSCWARNLCGGKCFGEILTESERESELQCKIKRHVIALQIYMYYRIINENCSYLERYKKK